MITLIFPASRLSDESISPFRKTSSPLILSLKFYRPVNLMIMYHVKYLFMLTSGSHRIDMRNSEKLETDGNYPFPLAPPVQIVPDEHG